jgi:D-tyrosyl-tRNA(Tyr) deacylase
VGCAVKAVLQRVSQASVSVDGEMVARINQGFLVLLGLFRNDIEDQAIWLARKTLSLRVFPDESKPMNRSIIDVGGEILVVSQFTLAADTSRGNRPGFSDAAEPARAEPLYLRYVAELREICPNVQTGTFGVNMQVGLLNDGPVTIVLER